MDNTDPKKKKKLVWLDEEISKIKDSLIEFIESGNPKDMYDFLNKELESRFICKEPILEILKQAGIKSFLYFFGTNTRESTYYQTHKEYFFKLLDLFFKKVGVTKVKDSFIEVNMFFIDNGYPEFSPEIINDFNSFVDQDERNEENIISNNPGSLATQIDQCNADTQISSKNTSSTSSDIKNLVNTGEVSNSHLTESSSTPPEQTNESTDSQSQIETGASNENESTDSQSQIETGASNENANIQHSNAANNPTNNHNIFLSLFVKQASINNKVDNSDTATFVLINELLAELLSLPKWLQNTTLIESLIKAGEQLAAIYDKTINYQTLFNKKIPVDFTFTHAESNDYREDPYIDKTEGKLVTRKNSSTNEPFDTSMALNEIAPLYSILPTDMGSNNVSDCNMLGLQHIFFW